MHISLKYATCNFYQCCEPWVVTRYNYDPGQSESLQWDQARYTPYLSPMDEWNAQSLWVTNSCHYCSLKHGLFTTFCKVCTFSVMGRENMTRKQLDKKKAYTWLADVRFERMWCITRWWIQSTGEPVYKSHIGTTKKGSYI